MTSQTPGPTTRARAPSPGPRRSLGRRLALTLLPLVLVPVILMGSVAYLQTRSILQRQATSQMTSIAQSEVGSILEWASLREQRLQLGTQRTSLTEPLAAMQGLPTTDPDYRVAAEAVRAELQSLKTREGQTLFSDLLVARLDDARVLVSTHADWEGVSLPPLVLNLVSFSSLITRPIYSDPILSPNAVALITLAPLRSGGAPAADAVLVGVNTDLTLGTLLEQLQFFWEQRGIFRVERGTTYLVLAPDVVIRLSRYSVAPEATVDSIHPALAQNRLGASGVLDYVADDGVQMLSAVEWIPEWSMGVVVELPQADVFAEMASLAPFSLLLAVSAAVVTVVVILLVTSRLLRPLASLAKFAERFAQRDWSLRVPEDRDDEIGALASALNRMAEDLGEMYRSLEARVEERTRQIRTAAEIARAVTTTPVLDDLLRRSVDLIRERFGYHHVSVFLLDRDGKNAVLAEATGEAGRRLKARGHSVAVGSQSIIGWVTANNRPRLASEVGRDPARFTDELLPETRSEAAVPLQIGGRVLGALDVQSTEPNAFGPQILEVLQTLADQLSAALQNARLIQASATAADRARLTSEVARELSGVLEVDRVLRTAASALYKALGQPEILVRVVPPEEETVPYSGLPGAGLTSAAGPGDQEDREGPQV